MPDLDYSPALNEDGTEFDIVKAAEIAKGAMPLKEADLDYWRREVAKSPRGFHDWPDDSVLEVVSRFLATLDAARAADAGLRAALDTLALVMRQLRDEGYHDWPDLLERDVLPALASSPAPAPTMQTCPECGAVGLADGPVTHAAPAPAVLGVERLGFDDLLSIGEALLEHYPPHTIVCTHHPDADIGARTVASIGDLIASCRAATRPAEDET